MHFTTTLLNPSFIFSEDIDADSVDEMSPRRLSCMTWQGLVSWLVAASPPWTVGMEDATWMMRISGHTSRYDMISKQTV